MKKLKLDKDSVQMVLAVVLQIAMAVVIAVGLIWQMLPGLISEQVATEVSAMVAELARPSTPTATVVGTKPPRGTPASPTATVVPSATNTPGATVTPTEVGTTTATPTPGIHSLTKWHLAKADLTFAHTHGVNPEDYLDTFGAPLADYLDKYGSISYPWNTPDENSPVGYGHHTGYIWLYDEARGGCESNQQPTPPVCVTKVLMEIHTDGTQAHLRKRFHSHYVFMELCDSATLTQCGVVGTGGWVDYGILETPYKGKHCPLPGIDPVVPSGYVFDLNQPPYRTSQTQLRGDTGLLFDPEYLLWNLFDMIEEDIATVVQFWSGLRPNAIVENIYDLGNGLTYPYSVPNQTVGVAWASLDSWGIVEQIGCANPETDTFFDSDGSSALNNTAFQLYAVFLYKHPPAPASGYEIHWTNRWGLEVTNCTVGEIDCVPLYITDGVPEGLAYLNRNVSHGDAEAAPILEFELEGGGIIKPAFPVLP